MRVLSLINGLGTGGAQRSMAETIPLLEHHGVETSIVSLRSVDQGVQTQIENAGIDVHYLVRPNLASRIVGLRQLIGKLQPGLVQTSLFDSDVLGRLASVRTDVPVLTSLVNSTYEPIRLEDPGVSRARLAGAQIVDGWTSRHLTSHFHAITEYVKRAAVRDLRLSPDNITVIERGRNPARLGERSPERRAETRQALGIADDAEVVITVGRQEYQKNQSGLVEAVSHLVAARPNIVLLLVGRSGAMSSDIDAKVKSISRNVMRLGHREDVPDLLAASDVFAFPSHYEGLGGALLEAMALGLPVVASDIDVFREVTENGANGTLVDPSEPKALAGAIADLLADPTTASEKGKRGHEIFERRFNLEVCARKTADLYHEVASRGR